jgi:hypothetical protein
MISIKILLKNVPFPQGDVDGFLYSLLRHAAVVRDCLYKIQDRDPERQAAY